MYNVELKTSLDNEIDALKQKLYSILKNQNINSDEALKASQKLDALIIKYYRDIYSIAV